MDQKNKAIKYALICVLLLAIAMVAFYKFAPQMRRIEAEQSQAENAVVPVAQDPGYSGIYTLAESVEGLSHRLGFFSINKKDTSYFGTAKLDKVADTASDPVYIDCAPVTVNEKEFYLKCSQPELGDISINGTWLNGDVTGQLLWNKDGNVITTKAVLLHRSAAN